MAWIDILWNVLLWTWSLYDEWISFTENQAYYNWYVFSTVSVKNWNYNNDNYEVDTYWSINTNWRKYRKDTKNPKIYSIEWYLIEESCVALEEEINRMTIACDIKNQQFKLKRRDWTIVFSNASVKVEFWERFDTTFYIPYTAIVTVYDWSMYWSVIEEQSRLSTTSNISTSIVYNKWNQAWLPYILIQGKPSSSITWVTIIIWDYTLTIPVSINDTDILLVDNRWERILKNWSELLSWTWELPKLKVWSNDFQVLFEWSPNVDVYLMTYPTYA